jgi:DNA repair photolyase
MPQPARKHNAVAAAWEEYRDDQPQVQRGRGASGNPANRFDAMHVQLDPVEPGEDDDRPKVATQFFRDGTKTIIARNNSPDVSFETSVNPYRGCEHGCAYCFARPTHEYLGFSAGLDFETRIMVKENAPELLEAELSSPKWKPQTVCERVDGSVSAVERSADHAPAAGCWRVRNPVGMLTKNRLVTRDIDVLRARGHNAVAINISVTTLDRKAAAHPRAAHVHRRRRASTLVAQRRAAGVRRGRVVAPIIPASPITKCRRSLPRAERPARRFAGYCVLRLPRLSRRLFERWLDAHFPGRKRKYSGASVDARRGSFTIPLVETAGRRGDLRGADRHDV